MLRKNAGNSPLILKYQQELAQNPNSKVFAPLAETYRKLGMLQEAVKTLRTGIKKHPSYVMGYLTLSACFFDQKNYEECYRILRPFISTNLENIRLQRLFADSCYRLSLFDEALETYKYILFLSPRDQEVNKLIVELEKKFLNVTETQKDNVTSNTIGEEDFWVQKDFIIPAALEVPQEREMSTDDQWKLETKLEVEKIADEPTQSSNAEEDESSELFTHTLIDLYCQQGLEHKAIEVLEKVVRLMPHDQKSKQRLLELKSKKTDSERLLEVFDKKVNKKSLQLRELENKFQNFLSLTKQRAHKYQDQVNPRV